VKRSRITLAFIGITMAAMAISLPAWAASYGGGSVQGYGAETPLDSGTIVQLTDKNSNRVKVASQSDLNNMFGVTVDKAQLQVTLSNDEFEHEVFVAVSGTYNVLVSTQAGNIEAGDYVTLSSIKGVAMRAGNEKVTVFGRAAKSFDGKSTTLGATALKDSTGNTTKTVQLGVVPVTIDIQNNPNDISTEANLPDMLKRVGQAIAEKDVNPIRIYLSLGIMVAAVIAAIVILYAGIRNGVISIGRNPMSKKSIFRALIESILTCLVILSIGVTAVYLLLKL